MQEETSCRGFGGVHFGGMMKSLSQERYRSSCWGMEARFTLTQTSPVEGEGVASSSPTGMRRGAKPLCRGSGGVPQFPILPQEWGIKGVETLLEQPDGHLQLPEQH